VLLLNRELEMQINQIKNLVESSYYSVQKAHEILFEEYNNRENEMIAAFFINKALSLMAAAKAIYYSNLQDLEKTELEDIFEQFSILESEFSSNYLTNHSHQWTDLEYQKFKEYIESFIEV